MLVQLVDANITYIKAIEGSKPTPRRKLEIERDGQLRIFISAFGSPSLGDDFSHVY